MERIMQYYKSVSIGTLALPGNIFLAPVAGYSDRAFRSLCIDAGADFTYTELVSSEAIARNPALYEDDEAAEKSPTANLLRRAHNEVRYGVQLFGANDETMFKATAALARFGPALVDINAGCPVTKVVKTGAGAALMRDPAQLGRIVAAVVRASNAFLGGAPVSVKLRSGWDFSSLNYAECAKLAVDAGASLVTLHPRTRTQAYGGRSDWTLIADLASNLPVPVAGSGDLFSPEDAMRMLRETRCAAVMFARGAWGNPFIFAATRALLRTGAYDQVSPSERKSAAFRQLLLLAADRGEKIACREMRKHFCAYTKGISGGAELRKLLVQCETIDSYRRLLFQ
jgi:nifR3 family TIM-barrel protein